ncbi:TolC family protein [Clostridium sp. BSD9I1]|uniref:TolC family protein n=1 Tax=Clostridium sp. BSD9I1 TaxID=2003589 RepID=UPI0016479857|nr:TolC family protein [Clostridium sp. BSD9I1]
MKKKFIISMALVMTAALSFPIYVSADSYSNGTASNSKAITTANTGVNTEINKTNTSASESNTPSKLNLSLEDALGRVENTYNQIVLDDRYIEVLGKQYEKALAYQKTIKQNMSNPMEEDDAKTLKLNVPVALYNLNNKKHEREVNLKTAKVTIISEYQSILAAQLNIDCINEEMTKLQKEIDSINARIKVGMATDSDVKQAEAAMSTYKARISSAQSNMKSAMISLKNDLGINLNTEITLTSKPIEYAKFNDADLDKRINTAVENSYKIKSLKEQIENTQIEYEIYDRYSNVNKDSTEITIEALKNQLEQTPNAIKVQIKTQYNALKSLESVIKADKLSIESAEISLNIAQKNYKVGQSTYLDVLSAELQLSKAKNALQQDIISYMTAAQGLENSLELQ